MHAAQFPPHYRTFGRRRSLRLRGFDYRQSRAYHLTWGTYRRKQLLAAPPLARGVMDLVKEEAVRTRMTLFAYCLMPDHVHLLICPETGADLVSFVQGFKGKTTRVYWSTGGTGRLWQRGFYDHILREDEDIKRVAGYILANPVRAGLAEDITQYPFSGSLVFDKATL
jgi:putative transposase